ncbi:MAG: hypothetical protein MPN21_05405 [Thermoanaerobaculia bacterium]|nr:hypothetical protein [Thermoanaerobaculia bacterium]
MSELEHLYSSLRGQLQNIPAGTFQQALGGLEAHLSATPSPRTQLTLRRLRFRGEKKGDFRFFPGVNVIRAGNDKGKSSLLKMIHYCLTGRNELKKDVDSWIADVELYFELAGTPHAILVRKSRRPAGRLVRCSDEAPEESQRGETLDSWTNGKEMQRKLEAFFNHALGLRPLLGTQKDSRKGSDALLDSPTSYRAYVRGLYITQDMGYVDLVTDGVPYGNLFMKIVGMLLGMRGIDAYFAVEARRAHVENQLAKEERYHRRVEQRLGLRDLATLDDEIHRLERYIDEMKVERTALLVRATSSDLDQRLTNLTDQLVDLAAARRQTAEAHREAELDLESAETEAAELASAISASELFSSVVPSRHPVFEIELTDQQRQELQERTAQMAKELRHITEERLNEAQRALSARKRRVETLRTELQELEFTADQIRQQKRHLQSQLQSAYQGTQELDHEIELETRYLGRLEAERDAAAGLVSNDSSGTEMKKLLTAQRILDIVLRHLRTIDADSNERRKQDFARRVQDFCTTIGFPGLEEVRLDAQLRPRISQNGKIYTFDELSPGEKVRFVLAFYLALAIATAEDLENGAHPGLLLIDSPGKEEMVEGDFEAVVKLLSQIEDRHAHSIQVVVATSLPAIRGATQISKQYFVADDDEPVFD